MIRTALAVILLGASTASAQVTVELRALKTTVLQGEPIYIVADIKNVGQYPIGYGAVGQDLQLEISGRSPYAWRDACASGSVNVGPFSFVDHPETFQPGQTRTFRYLLRGYRLEPGRHRIRVSGKAPVRWFQGQYFLRPGEPGPAQIPFGPGDPVQGEDVDREVAVEVVAASAGELQRVLQPLIENSEELYGTDLARAGVFESAHSFHTETIARLAAHPNHASRDAYEALADINTVDSREHLRRLYDASAGLEQRSAIVAALRRLSHPDSIDFLASLLPGRSAGSYDAAIKRSAVGGLVCIGGDGAAEALVKGTAGWIDQSARIELLSKTASRLAVDALVQIPVGGDFSLMLPMCRALSNLTHHNWCDEDAIAAVFTWPPDEKLARPVFSKVQSQWRSWWQRNRTRTRIHGPDEQLPEAMPKIW